jgi:zinc transporter ZupT
MGDDGTAVDVSAAKAAWDLEEEQKRLEMVIWLGWITAACTGLGVVPFMFTSNLPQSMVAVCNALACGMMFAASVVLIVEGFETRDGGMAIDHHCQGDKPCDGVDGEVMGVRWGWWGLWRTALGVGAGAVFVRVIESIVPEDSHGHHSHNSHHVLHDEATGAESSSSEDEEAPVEQVAAARRQRSDLRSADDAAVAPDHPTDPAAASGTRSDCFSCLPSPMRRALVFLIVMAAHSLAEGIGLGVSFGGARGHARGPVISSTLAVHNIPEGLAICLVLIPKGATLADAAAWAVWSSIPQPLFAVPALLFVDTFTALLPIGLGFAAGAMLLVSAQELWPQAAQKLGTIKSAAIVALAALGMLVFQLLVHDH